MPTHKCWGEDSACGEPGGTYLKISAQGQDGVAPGARLVTFPYKPCKLFTLVRHLALHQTRQPLTVPVLPSPASFHLQGSIF